MRWGALFDWRLGTTIAFTLGIFMLPWFGLESPFTAAESELFDILAKARRNSVVGNAPPVLQIAFDQDSRARYWGPRMPGKSFAEWPAVAPLAFIEHAMLAAKAGCLLEGTQRSCPQMIAVDIDVWPEGQPRPAGEVAAFSRFLSAWARDPRLPLVVLMRAPQLRQKDPAARQPESLMLAPSPWEGIVAAAPNLAWGSGHGVPDPDGVTRNFSYYTCVFFTASRQTAPLPGVALFGLAVSRGLSPAAAKAAVQRALNEQCPAGDPMGKGTPFNLVTAQSSKVHFPERTGLIGYHLDNPQRAGPAPLTRGHNGVSGVPTIRVMPGWMVFTDTAKLDSADGAIVFLSAAEPYFEDRHWTPYGEQAGALILANATRDLILEGPTRHLSNPAQYLVLLLGVAGIGLFVEWVEDWHTRLLESAQFAAAVRPKRRSLLSRKKTLAKETLYAATTRGGVKFLAGIVIIVVARIFALTLAPIGVWETIALVTFDITVYMLLDDLHSVWKGRHALHSY